MRRDVMLLAAAILLGAFLVAGSSRYRPGPCGHGGDIGVVCVVDGWTGKVIIRSPEGGQRELIRVVGEEWLGKEPRREGAPRP